MVHLPANVVSNAAGGEPAEGDILFRLALTLPGG
jgi:hypothetical protein